MKIFISLSALKLSGYKKWGGQKAFDKNFFQKLFERYTKHKKAYRIYLPILGKGLYVPETVEIPDGIESFLQEKGYKIEDYSKGIASQKDGKRIIKIGKLLKEKPELLKEYEQHKATLGSKDTSKLMVVISRHPYDIAGMSTGRGWDSCTGLGIGIKKKGEKGSNAEFVVEDVKNNCLVAYCINKDDLNIQSPICRLRILKYNQVGGDGYYLKAHKKVYGIEAQGFKETVQAWLDEVNVTPKSIVVYELPGTIYADGEQVFEVSPNTEKGLLDRKELIELANSGKLHSSSFREFGLVKIDKVIYDAYDLPKNLKVNGILSLQGIPITSLPEGLTVGMDMNIKTTKITSLPEGLSVGGSLDISRLPIDTLPKGLNVGKNLYASSTRIASLPEDLKVGGELIISDTLITTLPEGLIVGKDLSLNYSPITSLPNRLTVGGGLFLEETPVTSIPEDLKVGGHLYLRKSKITSLPKGLRVKGDLNLQYTPIASLPEGLTVDGNLHINNTQITSLPKGLAVGGSLYYNERTLPYGSFPKDLHVTGIIRGV